MKRCRRAGVVKLHHVAIDGTKVKANASKHKAMSYRRMLQEERRVRAEVERLLGEAEAVDASEDLRYGAGTRADELPEELRRGESRLKRIREAKAALEAEARKTRARALREQAEGHERTARTHPDPVVRRRARQCDEAPREGRAVRPGRRRPPGRGGGNGGGELPRKPTLATPQGVPVDEAQPQLHRPRELHHDGRGRIHSGLQRAACR